MNDICLDNRFKLIEKYKKRLIEATNIETSPEEMAVLDTILFRFWQMGWLYRLEMPVPQPTANVVEVVRCKDCKYYTLKPQQTSRVTSVRRCNRSAIVCTKPDDFCSFGERKK